MTEIYLFLGEHLTESDFERFIKKLDPLLKDDLNEKKIICILEYGGYPYINSTVLSQEVVYSDEMLRKIFDENKSLISSLTNKDKADEIQSCFCKSLVKLFLDLDWVLVWEDIQFKDYKVFVRAYYKELSDWKKNIFLNYLIA